MKALLVLLGIVFLAGLLVAGCIAVFNDEESFASMQLVSHDYECMDHECGGDWGGPGSDGNSGGRYEGGRGGQDYDGDGDGNRCRNFCFYGIPEPERASLFPPTPEGVRAFVVSTIESGIALGRLFADATIEFVSSLLLGIARA